MDRAEFAAGTGTCRQRTP